MFDYLKSGIFIKSTLGISIVVIATTFYPQNTHTEDIFTCDASSVSTTLKTQRGIVRIIGWANRSFIPSVSPTQRCIIASEKLQKLYENNQIGYIKTDIVNNLPVICNATNKEKSCLPNEVLATLQADINKNDTLLKVIDRRVLFIDVIPTIQHSPNKPKQFVSKINQEIYFDLKSLIDYLSSHPTNQS